MATLDLLWLELTSICNLECVHCYADSGPRRSRDALLDQSDYQDLIRQAARLSCRRLQFIGGEPTLVAFLPRLLEQARQCSIDEVEVFTNATHLSDELVSSLECNGVDVAVSFYSDVAEVHDSITGRRGSHAATVSGLRRLLDAGVRTRVCVIEMQGNAGHFEGAKRYLESIGVSDVTHDKVRRLGRALPLSWHRSIDDGLDPVERVNHDTDLEACASQLCGECGNGRLAVLHNGSVSPCVMARQFKLGSIKSESVEAVLEGSVLRTFLSRLRSLPRHDQPAPRRYLSTGGDDPKSPQCSPGRGRTDDPKSPQCSPGRGRTDDPKSPQCSPGRGRTDDPKSPQCSPGRGRTDDPKSPQCSPGRGRTDDPQPSTMATNAQF